jgi:hypothetical protein
MVGHIMGIGDRHTQNILVDTRTAEVWFVAGYMYTYYILKTFLKQIRIKKGGGG